MAKPPRRRSTIDPFLEQVGSVPDREIAELAGTSVENVRVYRKRRGIPSRWREQEGAIEESLSASEPGSKESVQVPTSLDAQPKRRHRRRSKLDPFLDRLGVLPDQEVARLAGVTVANVRAFRYRHDIPAPGREVASRSSEVEPSTELGSAFHVDQPEDPSGVPASDPASDTPSAASTEAHAKAFRIIVEGVGGTVSYVVVAADIAEAASKALHTLERRRVEGEVLSVEYLALALQD
jgi:hypothetical protein